MTEARKPQFGRTREEKLRIAAECRKYDIVETCKKHGIYTASYYDRVQRFALDDARGAYLEDSK